MLTTWRRLASAMRFQVPSGARSIAFVAPDGQYRVKGLRKDPEEYMVSPHGTRYPGTAETLQPVKAFLGTEYMLPDNLLLQCLVHKSFAHGKVPYNEKLALLGQQLLRLQSFRTAAATAMESVDHTVNGQNFNINNNAIEILTSTPVLSTVCDRAGLESTIFYNSAGKQIGPLVKAKAIHAIVGALLLERGEPVAIEFTNARLLSGKYSVFDIADSLFVHK